MDANACAQLIAKRRMISPGSMSDKAVPRQAIEQIIEAGNWAPSHRRTEPWRFVVIQGGALEKLAEIYERALDIDRPAADERTRQKVINKAMRSPVVIMAICHPSDLPRVKLEEEDLAVACAIQNMSLQATALGLSLFWSTGFPSAHPAVAQAMGCTGQAKVMGCLHLGYPGDSGWPEGRRQAWEDKVHWCDGHEIDVPTWRPNPGLRSKT